MGKFYSRRRFIRETGIAGAATVVVPALPKMVNGSNVFSDPDLVIVHGKDYFASTIKAVEMLGGINKFVTPGSKVGILVNALFEIPSALVKPDIPLAIVKMCMEAGAAEVTSVQYIPLTYWQAASHYEKNKDYISRLKVIEANNPPCTFNETDFVRFEKIPGAISLGEAEVVKAFLDCDVFINIPVSKHHATTQLTCALKNAMGVCTQKTNVSMHLGSGKRNDPDYLGQCIADIHRLKKTDLCIVDATEFITTGGPAGPGDIVVLDKIVAGTDIVAIDAFCAGFVGFDPADLPVITKAYESKLGNMNFHELNILELES